MKYLRVIKPGECDELLPYLMGKSSSTHFIKPYDNLVNRLVLGLPIQVSVPSKVNLEFTDGLYDYQIEDVTAMVNCTGYLNRNKPGYGKTVETVMACRNLDAESILVVAPKPTLKQWENAFCEWWPERADDVETPGVGTTLHRGKIYLVNPEKFTSKNAGMEFYKFAWDVVTVDEAHMLKNRKAKRTQCIKSLRARYRWALTGTPILRNPDDLWSILHFLNPEYSGGSYWDFTRYFCNVESNFYGEQINGLTKDPVRVNYLYELLNLVSCYHPERKTATGKSKITVELEMEKKQKSAYKKVSKLLYDELPEGMTIPNGAVKVLRLMQMTSAPGMFFDDINGIKFEWIAQFLCDNPDLKVVVYSRFEKALRELRQYLQQHKIKSCSYTGATNSAGQQAAKEQFIRDKNTQVILGTIQAMGVGVDGLQTVSHVCMFLDKDFLPEINNQCEDRLNRIGQTEEVMCYYLDCNGTWDKHVTQTNNMRISDIKRLLKEEN